MKNFILIPMLVFSSLLFAQFRLSGRINGKNLPDSVYLNIPFVYGYYLEHNSGIKVNPNGTFSKVISLDRQRFATININRKMFTLLLTPGRSLNISVNGGDTTIRSFTGNAAPQHRLLYELKLEEAPFFAVDTSFAKMNLQGLRQQVLLPWLRRCDKDLSKVRSSGLSATDKRLIAQEVRSHTIVALNDFARGVLSTGRKNSSELLAAIYENQVVSPDLVPAGPQYYSYANSFIGWLETAAFKDLPESAINDTNTVVKYFDVTIGEGNRIAKDKGKSYLNWMVAQKIFDKRVAENWLAQAIESKIMTKDMSQARPLVAALKKKFPESTYLRRFNLQMQRLEKMLTANADNKDIRIVEDFEKMNSIYEVIKGLKGKVVFLDIWGTWCGPCKYELKFNPQLKAHFKGKDVAFVYLDMDDDGKDLQWREFIRVNGLTGLHLRKNQQAIQSFWKELKPGSEMQYYPSYFIFDKAGKLVETDARRPSQRSELYKQLEQYLND